jgi:geranylgeranyl diphosphate synthase type I
MALDKTGFYSGISPIKIGAVIGGATDRERQALEEFGKNSAIAFQIQDDLLNILGDEATMGKDFLNDIMESKRTLMVIHCLENASAPDRVRLASLLRMGHGKSPDQVQEIVAMLRQYESIDFARTLARSLIMEARSYLGALRDTPARAALASMADFFLEREH